MGTPLRLKKKIQITMLITVITQLVHLTKSLSLRKLRRAAEFQRPVSRKERRDQRLCHGRSSTPLISQPTGTGEILKESTIFPGPRTNISLSTVDHAGLKELLQLSLIDSTSCSVKTCLLLSDLALNKLLTASTLLMIKVAMEVTQLMSTSISLLTVSLIHLASNMLHITSIRNHALQSTNAKTAHGLHAQSMRLAKMHAGLLTTRSTTFLSTTD